jgi:hypothetical protein
LGSRIAKRFAKAGLTGELPQLRIGRPQPAKLGNSFGNTTPFIATGNLRGGHFAWGGWSRMFLDEMAAGEPQRRWPEWLIHIPTVYHEFDFSRPYSYVVLPQDTL